MGEGGRGQIRCNYARCEGAQPRSQGSLSCLEGLCHGCLVRLIFHANYASLLQLVITCR